MSSFLSNFLSVVTLLCLFVTARLLLKYAEQSYRMACLDGNEWEEQQEEEHAARQRLMKERLDRIQDTCRRNRNEIQNAYRDYFGEDFNDGGHLDMNPDFLVARQQNIGWCKVPKVASTSMVQSLLRVLGRDDLLTSIGRSHQHTALRKVMPHPRPQETFPNLNAFMMVRHPFHRILSAYRDKIANKHDSEARNMFNKFRKEYNMPIINKFRKSVPPSGFYSDVPTFPEFVDYLINTSPTKYNEHWRPYFLTCLPCHVNYNIVLTLETIDNDIRILVERTGFPELKPGVIHTTVGDEPLLKRTPRAGEGRANYTIEYFSQIPKWKLDKLYEKYKIDFEMFGYNGSLFY